MNEHSLSATTERLGALKPSLRCYHWPFVWTILMAILVAGIIKRGWADGMWTMIISSTVVAGYMFFIDVADSVWWTTDEIWQRAWDYLSLKPMRHTIRIGEVTKVVSALHPANFVPGKPFDRISFVSPSDTIVVQASFHRREELEELLRIVQRSRPDAFIDPSVIEFMEGGFTDWWRYR
jgi:hypothetical protein